MATIESYLSGLTLILQLVILLALGFAIYYTHKTAERLDIDVANLNRRLRALETPPPADWNARH